MANWVRSALESVIHPDQTCAVAGRTISESLAVLKDTIAYVQDRGVDACLISLDQEKAFDTYMRDMLSKMGIKEGISHRLKGIRDQFETASGAKRPETASLKVLKIWFRGAGAYTKSWVDRITK
eukprot:g33916.t1